jgi:two-component system LytT family response regulator
MIDGRHGVLLVDDEALARRRMRQLLNASPDFEIIGECSDGLQVLDAVRELRPAVVFLDVKMPHLDGFEAREAIRAHVRHVVFVTAHTEFAARAFDVAASDYLVKPVTQARLQASLDRVRQSLAAPGSRRVLLGSRQGGATVDVSEVTWLEADGAYVNAYAQGRRHVLRESLAQVVHRLGPGEFIRIHRSVAINIAHVRGLRRGRGHGLEVELTDGMRLGISRRKGSEVVQLLRNAGRS